MRKILVTVITLSSLFGIGTVAATAEGTGNARYWNISVSVTDSSAPASCTGEPIPATWSPLDPTIPSSIDLFSPSNLDFYVDLGFLEGTDPCGGASVDPTGTVTTSYAQNPSPNDLGMGTLDCLSGCLAQSFYGPGSGAGILVSPNVPSTTGTFGGRLEVVWAPAG